MKEDRVYQLLRTKMQEISWVPPQSFGFFTPLYKVVVPYFKYNPWVSVGIISAVMVFCLYFLFGTALVKLASLLQFGF